MLALAADQRCLFRRDLIGLLAPRSPFDRLQIAIEAAEWVSACRPPIIDTARIAMVDAAPCRIRPAELFSARLDLQARIERHVCPASMPQLWLRDNSAAQVGARQVGAAQVGAAQVGAGQV